MHNAGRSQRCAHALRGDGSFGCRARQERHKFLAAQAADNIGCAKRFPRNIGEEFQDRVAARMPVSVVDRFELIEIKGQNADRRHAAAAGGCHQAGRSFKESAPVQQPGQWIARCRHFVAIHRMILGQHQHDQSRSNNVE